MSPNCQTNPQPGAVERPYEIDLGNGVAQHIGAQRDAALRTKARSPPDNDGSSSDVHATPASSPISPDRTLVC